jgi:hypothetical protein
METRETPQIKMRIVNGIELDDGVDEPDAYDWHDQYESEPNNRPQDGRVCNCEDAPCCGHYEL